MDLRKIYRNKRVFITGITGFKGAWMALLLHRLGAKVSGFGLQQVEKDTVFYQCRISDFAKVYIFSMENDVWPVDCVHELQSADYVFHFAAQPIVAVGYALPVYTFDVNTIGTVKLLEYLKGTTKDIKVLSVASDRVYNPKGGTHTEGDTLVGFDPYSLSKVFTNQVVDMYAQMSGVSDKLHLMNARTSNVLGGGDRGAGRLLTCIEDAKITGVLEIRNPLFVRPYVYVLDCLCQYLYILAKGKHSVYNIGGKCECPVSVETLINTCKKDNRYQHIEVVTTEKSFGFEGKVLRIDTDRFVREFQFQRGVCKDIEDIIHRVIEYNNATDKMNVANSMIQEAIAIYSRKVVK